MRKLDTNHTNTTKNRPVWRRLPGGNAILLAGACLSLGCVSAMAVGTNWGGSYYFNFGNGWAGASGGLMAYVQNSRYCSASTSGSSRAYVSCRGGVNFLNRSLRAVDFVACAGNNSGTKSANYSLAVVGYVVDSGTKTETYAWNRSVSQTFWSGSATYTIGYVPITLAGSVGGGANVGYTLQLPDTGAGLAGSAAAWINGTASAGVGLDFFSVGLYSELELGKTSIQPALRATPTALSGKVDLVFDPINIELDLAVVSFGRPWASVEVASYHAPAYTWPLIKGFSISNGFTLSAPTTGFSSEPPSIQGASAMPRF